MKYDALALRAEDLKVGTDEALMQFLNTLGEQTKVVAANVVPAAGFEATDPAQPADRGRPGPHRDHRRARPRDPAGG